MSVNVFTIKNKTSYDNINSSSDNIAIIGLTSNCKAGATIVSAHEQKRYYLDGIDYWEDTLVGKTIKVSGRLAIEDLREETVNEGEIIPQQMIGIKRTILNPAWEIMK